MCRRADTCRTCSRKSCASSRPGPPPSSATRRLPLRGRRTALQVRGVPRELRERVRRDAERRGLSLSQYVLGIIQEALAFPMFEEWVEELRRDPPVHLPKPAAEYLHEARRAEGWED